MNLTKISGESLAGLLVSRQMDEFSAKYSLEGDPHFWLRIELPAERPIRVSDLLPGKVSETDAARILSYALHDISVGPVDQVLFTHVVMVDDALAGERLVWIDRVLEAYVSHERRFIVGKRLLPRGDKTDLLVEFKTFGTGRS